jgi:soluble lytic murein transglycosylase
MANYFRGSLIFLFLTLVGCSSSPKKPIAGPVAVPAPSQSPAPELIPPKVSVEPEDRAPRFSAYRSLSHLTTDELAKTKMETPPLERWRQHTLALRLLDEKPAESCPLWQSLAADTKYPLHKLAQLHLEVSCDVSSDVTHEAKGKNPIDFSSEEKSLYDELIAAKDLQAAILTDNLEDDVAALLENAHLSSHFQEREETFKKALAKAKEGHKATVIANAEAALFKNSPRLNPHPKDTEMMSVAADYRLWREFDPALKIYRSIAKNRFSKPEEKLAALKAIRQTLKTAERRNEYIESTAEIARWTYQTWKKFPNDFQSQKRFYDSQMLLARTLWTEERTEEALKTLKRTERWLTGRYPLDELNFIRSRIYEGQKDYNSALLYLKKAVEEKSSKKDLREKLLWAEAWLLYKTQKYEQALAPLKELIEKTQDNPEKVKAMYWSARCQLKLDRPDDAKVTFKNVLKEDPLGFYGLLASRELNEKIQPLQADTSADKDERLADVTPKELKSLSILSDWLVAVGENKPAEKSLNRISDQLRKQNVSDEDVWLRVFSQYAQTGSYLPLFSNLTLVKAETREAILKSHPEILFPRPYKEVVDKASARAQVPSSLVYAIMRQESAFNPKARSPVDAYGLMQLMPSIAKSRAQQKKFPFNRATDLYDPETNVTLGAYELQALLNRYNQQYIMAISAYNASEKALKGWIKSRYRLDPLEFIEEIPYEETRGYIKLVLRNYIFYLRFASTEPFVFPESCLKLGQNNVSSSQAETK